jgi:hypothetical protein
VSSSNTESAVNVHIYNKEKAMTAKNILLIVIILFLILTFNTFAEFQVNTSTNDVQEKPSVALDPNGDFVVVWKSNHTGSRGIYGQRFDAEGEPVGNEFKINTTSVNYRSYGPDVAMDNNGNFVVVWTGYRSSEEHIIARRYDSNGLPMTGEFVVSTDKYADISNGHLDKAIAMNASGAFVIVWSAWHGIDDHNGTWGIYYRLYDASAVPLTDEFRINQIFHGYRPDVAIDESGDFVVVWQRVGDKNNLPYGRYVAMRRYNSDGTPKTGEIWITEEYDWNNKISIGGNPSGDYVVSYGWGNWQDPNIHAQLFDSNGIAQGDIFMVNEDSDSSHSKPSASMFDDGQFIIAWNSPTAWDLGDISLRRYNKDANPIGDQTVFNTYLPSRQRYPDTAVNSKGTYVVVWQSYGQDGDDYGIFGQIGPKTCCADFSGDMYVNFRDYCVLAEEWMNDSNSMDADILDDNKINILDLCEFGAQWLGYCYSCKQANISQSDNKVNWKDYAIFANDYGKSNASFSGDITGNGTVDYRDFQALISRWLCYTEE